MKKAFLCLAFAVGTAVGYTQDTNSSTRQAVDLKTVLGPQRAFHDPGYGVKLTYPEGWTVANGLRWGTDLSENTFNFELPRTFEVRANFYYQRYTEPVTKATVRAWFETVIARKEAARRQIYPSYRNRPESIVFRTTPNGLPCCSYVATFQRGDREMAEYNVRVAGTQVYVMLFNLGPAEEINALRLTFDRLADTVQLP